MILMLMFGLPIIAMAVGDSCYNLEKTNMKIINGMEQLHIMFSNTQFHDSQKSCDMDPFCKTSIATFRQVTNPYLRLYVSNITLAGACCGPKPMNTHFSLPHHTQFNARNNRQRVVRHISS